MLRSCSSIRISSGIVILIVGLSHRYPGRSQRGVSGLGFPFFFWPVTWGAATAGGVLYLHDTEVRSIFYAIVSS